MTKRPALSQRPPQAARPPGGTRAVVVACVGAFVSAMSTSLVAVAAPTIARDLGATQANVGWVLTAYLLVVSALLAGAGRLSDLFGRRRVYLAGFTIFAVGSFACGVAPTLPLLVGSRVVQGLGACALMATGPAIITHAFPPERRARGLGLQLAATYTGLTLGPTIGGLLTTALGWHAVFFAVGAGALVGFGVAFALLPLDEPPGDGASMDVVGTILFAVAMGTFLVALRRAPGAGVLAVVSVLAFVVFLRHEASHPAPVLPLGLFRTPAFAFGIAGSLLLYMIAFVLAWLLPFHLQRERGMDARHAGVLVTSQPAMFALVSPVSGWLADRFGPRLPSVLGMLVMATGLFFVGRVADGGDAGIVVCLAIVGLGGGLFVAPNNAVLMGAAPRERQGTAAAMGATARNVGMTAGVALATVLHDAVGFARSLAVAAALALVAALLGTVRPVVKS